MRLSQHYRKRTSQQVAARIALPTHACTIQQAALPITAKDELMTLMCMQDSRKGTCSFICSSILQRVQQ